MRQPTFIRYQRPRDFTDRERIARAAAYRDELSRRRTVREFADRPVPREVIESCVATAATAPSGANHQPWHFVVVSDADTKRRIRAAAEEEKRLQRAHALEQQRLQQEQLNAQRLAQGAPAEGLPPPPGKGLPPPQSSTAMTQQLLEEEGILEEGWDDEVAQTRISQIQRDIDAIKEEAQQRAQRKKTMTLH